MQLFQNLKIFYARSLHMARLELSTSGDFSLTSGLEALRSGGIIALPTDTIYGLAAMAQNSEAVQRLYHVKRRLTSKPLAICLGQLDDIHKWCVVTIPKPLLQRLLPGPVTLVFNRTQLLNPDLNPGNPLVGIRVPDYPLVRQLCDAVGGPLALTSANISESTSTVSVEEFEPLWPEIDVIYDGGVLGSGNESRLGSTVVNLSVNDQFSIIRKGSAYEQTMKILRDAQLKECTGLG